MHVLIMHVFVFICCAGVWKYVHMCVHMFVKARCWSVWFLLLVFALIWDRVTMNMELTNLERLLIRNLQGWVRPSSVSPETEWEVHSITSDFWCGFWKSEFRSSCFWRALYRGAFNSSPRFLTKISSVYSLLELKSLAPCWGSLLSLCCGIML